MVKAASYCFVFKSPESVGFVRAVNVPGKFNMLFALRY